MLDALLSTFKAGTELKAMVAALNHVDSLGVNVIDMFTSDATTKNAAIDAICAMLQAMKVSVVTPTATNISTQG